MRCSARCCSAGLLFGKSLLGVVFDSLFHLTEEGWRKLTLRWALFFFALAVLNEIVWRNTSTDVWVDFKVFGVAAADLPVRRAAISAAEEIRRRAGGVELVIASAAKQSSVRSDL